MAAVSQLHIPQDVTTIQYYYCNIPVFSKLHHHRSLQGRQSYPLPPFCYSSLFVACRKMQPVAFLNQRLRNVVEIKLLQKVGRSTCGTRGLNCNITSLLIAFRVRHEVMTKFLTHRKHTASPRQTRVTIAL